MEEFEPIKKNKIITKTFLQRSVYVLVLALLSIGGISYCYTFFVQNYKIASIKMQTAELTINVTNRDVSASNLSKPSTDQEGLKEFSKLFTITNTTSTDGRVDLFLSRTSGLQLTDMRYALIINDTIQEIKDVPTSGLILSSAILGNETLDVELKLWPKTTYSGSETTFVGEITPEIRYLGLIATSYSELTGKYVDFNCAGTTCEVWQVVKVEDGRLVLTRQADYSGATARTNSNRFAPNSFEPALTFNDDSLITSLSTDGKNVYLLKTVKIGGGTGTLQDPYTLINRYTQEDDKKILAIVTYKDGTTTLGTQLVYYNETNYISRTLAHKLFDGWDDGTHIYNMGDVIAFSSDTILNTDYIALVALDLDYDNTSTHLNCDTAQCAIDEIYGMVS